MPEITLYSKHINKKQLNEKDVSIIENDIRVFNKMKHRAFRIENAPLSESVHMTLKHEYGVNDYFANSAHNEAKAVRKSAKEALIRNIDNIESQIKQKEKKIKQTEKRLSHLYKEKESLIKKKKFHSYKGANERKLENGTFEVGKHRKKIYENEYLFELLYLDPEIKKLKHRINEIRRSLLHLEIKYNRLNNKLENKDYSVCFGSKKAFKKQFTKLKGKHDIWKKQFEEKRYKRLTISGRRDAKGGNFVFRYDGKILTYESMSGEKIQLPCEFPYKQELVNKAVTAIKADRKAVCWSIEDWNNSFIVKCMINTEPVKKNYCYKDGTIGMDTNFDNISIVETDANGNLLSHEVIKFDILNKSSEQIEQELSLALEKVFKKAVEKNKPITMEKLEDIKQEYLYKGKRLNKTLSMFAYSKITELMLSKSNKYNIEVKMVNPAFTSQMGKIKYQKRYGITVHESAALVIARRGQGFSEKLPSYLKPLIPETKINKHHWSHWRHLQQKLKKIKWTECYNKVEIK